MRKHKLFTQLVAFLALGIFFTSTALARCQITYTWTDPDGNVQTKTSTISSQGGGSSIDGTFIPSGTPFTMQLSVDDEGNQTYYRVESPTTMSAGGVIFDNTNFDDGSNNQTTIGGIQADGSPYQFQMQPGESLHLRVFTRDSTIINQLNQDDELCNMESRSIDAAQYYSDPSLQRELIVGDSEKLGSFDLCKQISDPVMQTKCASCLAGGGLFTAVGCVTVDAKGEGLAADLIRLLLGIGGGLGLLSILAASFVFTTSQGDTSKVKQAKELMTAAVSGLLFIIFSVIILDFIGVRIFRIPGLG